MTECAGLFGRLFGHKYEPRYTVGEPTARVSTVSSLVFAEEVVAIMEASKSRTYHGDRCIRCGHFNKEAA